MTPSSFEEVALKFVDDGQVCMSVAISFSRSKQSGIAIEELALPRTAWTP